MVTAKHHGEEAAVERGLDLVGELASELGAAVLFISHDLGLVGEIADQVVVMRHGQVREQGPVARIFAAPEDAYTKALLACRPSLEGNPARLMVIDDHIAGRQDDAAVKAKDPAAPVVLEVKSLAKSFWLRQGLFGKREFKAVQNVNFKLRRGHTLGVVGESGSGKTTMGLTLLRLHEPTGGEVIFDGKTGALIGAHLFFVVKLGTTAPPWVRAVRPKGARPQEEVTAGVAREDLDQVPVNGAVAAVAVEEPPVDQVDAEAAAEAPAEEAPAAEEPAADETAPEEPPADPADAPSEDDGDGEVKS